MASTNLTTSTNNTTVNATSPSDWDHNAAPVIGCYQLIDPSQNLPEPGPNSSYNYPYPFKWVIQTEDRIESDGENYRVCCSNLDGIYSFWPSCGWQCLTNRTNDENNAHNFLNIAFDRCAQDHMPKGLEIPYISVALVEGPKAIRNDKLKKSQGHLTRGKGMAIRGGVAAVFICVLTSLWM